MTNTRKRVLRTLLTLLITPFALVLVLGILLYLPPIQRWAVRQAASYLSSQTGIEVTLDRVRLSFPLDVSLGGVRAVLATIIHLLAVDLLIIYLLIVYLFLHILNCFARRNVWFFARFTMEDPPQSQLS